MVWKVVPVSNLEWIYFSSWMNIASFCPHASNIAMRLCGALWHLLWKHWENEYEGPSYQYGLNGLRMWTDNHIPDCCGMLLLIYAFYLSNYRHTWIAVRNVIYTVYVMTWSTDPGLQSNSRRTLTWSFGLRMNKNDARFVSGNIELPVLDYQWIDILVINHFRKNGSRIWCHQLQMTQCQRSGHPGWKLHTEM